MPKISALTSLAQADVVTTTDVLPIVDATAPATTKKVTVQAMVNAGLATLTTLPSGIVNASLNSIVPYGGAALYVGTGLSVAGSISATTYLTVGSGTGNPFAAINGAASGTSGGASLVVQNAGNPIVGIGNKSALLGGAYDATPMLYGNAPIEVNQALNVTGSISATSYVEGAEQAAPAAPAANGYRIFAQDNGAGKTQLMVIFASGAAQQIAIEP